MNFPERKKAKSSQSSWFRRLLRAGLWFGLAVLLLVATSPYWLGMAVRVFGPSDLLQFESYETSGYGRFVMRGVDVEVPAASVRIDEVEGLTPLNWLYRSWSKDRDALNVRAGTVKVEVHPTQKAEKDPNSNAPQSVPEIFVMLEGILDQVDPYLETLTVDEVTVEEAGRSHRATDLRWEDRALEMAASTSFISEKEILVKVSLKPEKFAFGLRMPSRSVSIESVVTHRDEFIETTSSFQFLNNEIRLEANFGSEGWLPTEANWQARNWELTNEEIGVNSAYSDYKFEFDGVWDGVNFENRLEGTASQEVPEGETKALSSLDVDSVVSGDLSGIRIDAFQIDAPGFSASMQEPVSVDFETKAIDGEARFDINFDLSLLGSPDLAGTLVGSFEFASSEKLGPQGKLRFNGEAIEVYSLVMDEAVLEADLNWPQLEVSKFAARLSDSSNVEATASLDLQEKLTRSGNIKGQLESEFLERYLPSDTRVSSIGFDANVSGPWLQSEHSGSLSFVDFDRAPLRTLSGQAKWTGVSSRFDSLEMRIDSERGRIDIAGNVDIQKEVVKAHLDKLYFAVDGDPFAHLDEPVYIEIALGESPQVTVPGLSLSGPNGSVIAAGTLSGLQVGDFELSVQELDMNEWTAPWLLSELPAVYIQNIDTSLVWDNGPMVGQLEFAVASAIDGKSAHSQGNARFTNTSLFIDTLNVADSEGPLFVAKGEFPVSYSPGEGENALSVDRQAPLLLELNTDQSETLNAMISRLSKIDLGVFAAQADISGTLSDPRGTIELTMVTEEISGEYAMPVVAIDAHALFEGRKISFDRINIGQASGKFEAKAEIELPTSLADLIDQRGATVAWAETYLSLDIENSSLTPLVYFAPQTLSTGGTVQAQIKGSVESGFDGRLAVKNLNTRSIFPFGAMRDVELELEFDERLATLKGFSGKVGREPLNLSGWLSYEALDDLSYQLKVVGKELPLLRRVGLLLRTDLDLSVRKDRGGETLVGGRVNLRDGLFLMDTTALLDRGGPGGRSAENRPPYFSVNAPPFSNWNLDVELVGDNFMRVQTPAAKGKLSTKMALKGTLQEPFVTGDVNFESGELIFPFAAFAVDQGLIQIRIDDPYTPKLEILGKTRRFGYDLEVEVLGSAFDPNVRFSSSPPLSSEQILLMVMAGENPEGTFDYSNTQRASKLGSYLSKGIFSSGGNSGPGSRFSLSSGENLSRQGKETLEMEVLLNERFQLVGEYDEFDAWNGGIRWRIRDPRRDEKDTEKKESEKGE